jgi:hypothetical protein
MIFKKCPFKENGKLSKLFHLVPQGLNLPAGSDAPQNKLLRGYQTPQNKILQGIRPQGTKSCRVSDPAEQMQSGVHFIADTCSARSDTSQNNILRDLIPPASQSSTGYQTPWNKVLRGVKPRTTTFKYKYFCKFETEFQNILGCEFGDYMGLIRGKNRRSKISCYCLFKYCII